MKNKLLFIVLSVVLTIFSGCKTESTDAAADDYTLLIYMCGSSLESKNGAASDDISELLSADIPHNVNVVLETGGSVSWKSTEFPPKSCKDTGFPTTIRSFWRK